MKPGYYIDDRDDIAIRMPDGSWFIYFNGDSWVKWTQIMDKWAKWFNWQFIGDL